MEQIIMSNSDSPANPTQYMDYSRGRGELHCDNNDLTKREAFAMAAMQGLLANSEPNSWSEEQWYKKFS